MLCVDLQPQDSRQAHPYRHTVSAELFTYKYMESYENKTHIQAHATLLHALLCVLVMNSWSWALIALGYIHYT